MSKINQLLPTDWSKLGAKYLDSNPKTVEIRKISRDQDEKTWGINEPDKEQWKNHKISPTQMRELKNSNNPDEEFWRTDDPSESFNFYNHKKAQNRRVKYEKRTLGP